MISWTGVCFSKVPKFFGPIWCHNSLIRIAEVLSCKTSQSSWFSYIKYMIKRSALENRRIAVWQLAFRAWKVLVSFGKQAPGQIDENKNSSLQVMHQPNKVRRSFRPITFEKMWYLWFILKSLARFVLSLSYTRSFFSYQVIPYRIGRSIFFISRFRLSLRHATFLQWVVSFASRTYWKTNIFLLPTSWETFLCVYCFSWWEAERRHCVQSKVSEV